MNIVLLEAGRIGEGGARLLGSEALVPPEGLKQLGNMAVRPTDYLSRILHMERQVDFHGRQVESPDMPPTQRNYHVAALAAREAALASLRREHQ